MRARSPVSLAREAALVGFALALAGGCEHPLSFGTWHDLAGDGGGLAERDSGLDGATLDAAHDANLRPTGDAAVSVPFSCSQRGPLFALSDSVEGACPEPRGHHYALCSCQDINNDGGLAVDGFDSRRGPYAAGETSGSVASHGPLNAAAPVDVGGSLLVGGNVPPLGGVLDVGGDLSVRGALESRNAVHVGGDAYLAGDVRVAELAVVGAVTISETSYFAADAGAYTRARLTIPAPCRCEEGLDRARLIDAAKLDNDNGLVAQLASGTLSAATGPIDLSLPCGRYYVRRIFGAHPVTLRVRARALLYVDEGILLDLGVPLTIELDPDAELDLFVRFGITANGPVTIGSASTSTRVRIHVGSSVHNLYFADRTSIGGALYAPSSDLVAQGRFELFGAAIVRRALTGASTLVHYDRALDGDMCEAASCSASRPCRAPLRCDVNRCLP